MGEPFGSPIPYHHFQEELGPVFPNRLSSKVPLDDREELHPLLAAKGDNPVRGSKELPPVLDSKRTCLRSPCPLYVNPPKFPGYQVVLRGEYHESSTLAGRLSDHQPCLP